jgi:hypothetical protein
MPITFRKSFRILPGIRMEHEPFPYHLLDA